ncbi:unnamed protein product [Rhodiola kirilowii]
MAGGRRKVNKRIKIGRRKAGNYSRNMFVVGGGELADWPNPSSTSGRKMSVKKDEFKSRRVQDASEAKSLGSRCSSKKDQKDVVRYAHSDYSIQGSVSSEICCLREEEDNVPDMCSPITLVDSGKTSIVAYIDDVPSECTVEPKYTYAYSSGFVLDDECTGGLDGAEQPVANSRCMSQNGAMDESMHLGSLYENCMPEVNTVVTESLSAEMSYQVETSGFLSIGGMKLYAQDLSDQEDGYDYENISDGEKSNYTESLSGSDDSDDDDSEFGFSMDSDLEEDIAEDYLEGIGGLQEVIDVNQLFENAYDDDLYNSSSYSKSVKFQKVNSSRKKSTANMIRSSHIHAPRSKIMKRCTARITMPSKSVKFVEEALGSDNNLCIKSSKVSKGRWVASRGSTKEKDPKGSKSTKNDTLSMNQPVPFVSRGILDTEITEVKETIKAPFISNEVTSTSYGAFEAHTTGFGSRIMAKMGFSGGGLGKDGQGMAEPIEVTKRPKSLGLGVQFTDVDLSKKMISRNEQVTITQPIQMTKQRLKAQQSSKSAIRPKAKGSSSKSSIRSKAKRSSKSSIISTAYPSQSGAFEKHTGGFGSKMMSKMGFVEGAGLGRNLQGIVSPLAAVRRPKSLGLGAEH